MKKDYIALQTEIESGDETEFVASYWTDIWNRKNLVENAEQEVRTSEVFPLVDPFLSRLADGSRILDGGCGLGEWTIYYTQRNKQMIGMDISQKTIERLQQHYPQCRFQVGDIRQTGCDENAFDAMISWGTFEHFEMGLAPCFREAWRILKPGGLLIVTVPFQNIRHLWRDWKGAGRESHVPVGTPQDGVTYTFYQWRLTRAELALEFQMHGFEVERIVPVARGTGLKRLLQHEWGIKPGDRLFKPLFRLFNRLLPDDYVGHMLLGIGKKRGA